MEKNKLFKVPTCNPKNSSTAQLSSFLKTSLTNCAGKRIIEETM